MRRRLIALLGLGLAGGPALAQQVLYEPLPPRGSAQLRFVNALAEPIELRPSFARPISLGTEPAARVGRYAVVPAVAGRSFSVGLAGRVLPLTLPPDRQVTVVLVAGAEGPRAQVIVDEVEFNQARARLRYYNATPDCAAALLALQPAGARIFAEIPPGEARMRAVNPVAVEVQAGCATGEAPAVSLRNLEAGAGYSIWLMAPGGRLTAFVTADGTKPWVP